MENISYISPAGHYCPESRFPQYFNKATYFIVQILPCLKFLFNMFDF